jgi:tRNA-dihydrouridine synthase A
MRVAPLQRQVSVAPMMAYTDRHFRYLLRLVSPTTLLYTEMITAQAVLHGSRERLLAYDVAEHPVALQLGGSDPGLLADAAAAGAALGYDEINLNVGCPSERVRSGSFGACLMADPELVADCLRAMIGAVPSDVAVTVKCRIGIDGQDDYGFFERFVSIVAASGVRVFIVHARKAVLSGLSPRENREIPPLRYELPQRLKRERPDLTVVLNGGLRTVAQACEWLPHFDGIMFGRQVCEDPWLLALLDATLLPRSSSPTRAGVVARYADYVDRRLEEGHRPASLLRHAQALFTGFPGARAWRRLLAERVARGDADGDVLRSALPSLGSDEAAGAVRHDTARPARTGT